MRLFFSTLIIFLFQVQLFAQCDINEEEFELSIITNTNADNAFWSITSDSDELMNFGFQLNQNDTFIENFCLPQGTYNFVIDKTGSSSWTGTYALKNADGQNVASGSGINTLAPAAFAALGIHPCQEINGSVSYNLPPETNFTNVNFGDTVLVCYDINLQTFLNFPENNTDYNQSVTNVSYLWEVSNPLGISDGQVSTNNTAHFEFDDYFIYKVSLTVTDTNDCSWSHEIFVKNSSANTFIDLTVDNSIICIGETTNIHATYVNTEFETEVAEPDPIFLDDVVGGQYESVISINHFLPTDTLTEDCILKVCADMEHTFAGDLTIFLTLPNGDTVDFVPDLNGSGTGNGFGGIAMGEPGLGSTPGVPYQYCWTPTAPQTMHDYVDVVGTAGTTFEETIINADGTFTNDYAANPDGGNGWENAVGSSINGDWTFHIIDTWASDDGFIFGWNFELCKDTKVSYVDSFWVGTPGSFVTTADENSLSREIIGVATPNSTMVYEYHMIDNFGCEWVEEIEVQTTPVPVINPGTTIECNDTYQLGVVDTGMLTGSWSYEGPTGVTTPVVFNPNVFDLTPEITVPETGIYKFTYTSECGAEVHQTINFVSFAPVPEIGVEQTVECDNEYQLLAIDTSGTVGFWTYLVPPGAVGTVVFSPSANALTPTVTVPVLGTYEFTYMSTCGLGGVQTVNFVSKAPTLNIENEILCNFDIDLVATNPVQDGVWSVTTPAGETATIADETSANTSAVVSDYGIYTFTFTYEFCESSFSQTVEFKSEKPKIIQDQSVFICDSEIELEAEVEGQVVGWSVIDGPGVVNFSSFDTKNTTASFDGYGIYQIQFEGCGNYDTIEVVFEKKAPNIYIPEFVECGLQALIEVDFSGDKGSWSVEPKGNEVIDLVEQDDNKVIITSDRYGAARVTYTACDTSRTEDIVFMCKLDVPNVFSPNNDGYNNEFIIPRLSSTFYDKSRFVVYDRWGVAVYNNGQYGLNGSWWNGRTNNGGGEDLPEGVYFYELNLNNKVNNLEENYKGSINLFR